MSDHFFVVTGGPGAGKTSLITELCRRGLHTIPESGRAVIREEMQSGGDAFPWADRMAYAEQMLERDPRADSTAHPRSTAPLRPQIGLYTSTSTCRSFATSSSGSCLFSPIPSSSIRLESLLQDGPLFWGRPQGACRCDCAAFGNRSVARADWPTRHVLQTRLHRLRPRLGGAPPASTVSWLHAVCA